MASSDLDVLLNGRVAGRLSESAAGLWSFAYSLRGAGQALEPPVSLALPRRQSVYQGDRVRAVFCNLPPEGEIRVRPAQSLASRSATTLRCWRAWRVIVRAPSVCARATARWPRNASRGVSTTPSFETPSPSCPSTRCSPKRTVCA
ncbi:MAG: HipA N-terminal domain-containing protein [Proteobacteria bacterium]|nr:HipA N-terminal domain-containing protein [Pseudomonadota bacterium]